jgi:hypothetical protein
MYGCLLYLPRCGSGTGMYRAPPDDDSTVMSPADALCGTADRNQPKNIPVLLLCQRSAISNCPAFLFAAKSMTGTLHATCL